MPALRAMNNFRSTFPLNEAAIARKALSQIMTDPITWVPLVPAVAAYAIFDVPAPVSLGFGALVLGGVGMYWRKQWDGVTDALRRKAIVDHNRAQDAILKAAADDLRLNGAVAYANKLEQFLAGKRQVEARIHEDSAMTAQKIQIEQLIDALCFGCATARHARREGLCGADRSQEPRSQVDAIRDAAIDRQRTRHHPRPGRAAGQRDRRFARGNHETPPRRGRDRSPRPGPPARGGKRTVSP